MFYSDVLRISEIEAITVQLFHDSWLKGSLLIALEITISWMHICRLYSILNLLNVCSTEMDLGNATKNQ